jgi:hypothetical protein
MRRITFAVAMLGALCASPARADTLTLPMFDDAAVPDSYTPGVPFSFKLSLPALSDFTGYTVEVDFTAEVEKPSLSFSVDRGADYPFPAKPFPLPAAAALDADQTTVHLFFSDSVSSPSDPADAPDFVTINVTAGADVGNLSITIGADTAFAVNSETRVLLPQDAYTLSPRPASSVPAPGGAVLLGVGGLILAARRVPRAA